jgi:energy-coupling factor transport system ATP-binding protein
MSLIEVNNLKFKYSDEDRAVNGVSFNIEQNEFVCVLGHNGSGKSTLAKLLVGLLKAQSGTIKIKDIELTEETIDKIRHHIGIVFQNPDNQFVGVTVKDDIAFGLENRQVEPKEMHKKITECASKVGLLDYLDREPYKLSGGEKQRVAIAGILALDSKYIIFDEATSMLDPNGVNDVVNLIKELREKTNKTIITITHDLELAKKSDEVFVFKKGQITASGKPEDIFRMEDILTDSNLLVPLELQLYQQAVLDKKLKNDKELIEALWELSLMK